MVDDYLSDREQEEALRNWWRENWRWIFGGIALGIALLVGYFQWQDYRARQAEQAGAQYAQVRSAFERNDLEQAQQALDAMAKDHGSSPYTQQARLLVAKLMVEEGDLEQAASLLRAASERARDEELKLIARLRLARVLVQQGQHDEAIELLNVAKLGAFAAAAREIRGDAQLAKGNTAAARAEYAAALAADDARIDRNVLEMKLREIGGEVSDVAGPKSAAQAKGGQS